MATHSSILAWRIPWTEEPGGLQFMGLQRVGHYGVTDTFTSFFYLSKPLLCLFPCSPGEPVITGSVGLRGIWQSTAVPGSWSV